MWIPGVASPTTVKWAAEHRYPYVMLAMLLGPTKEMFDYYYQCAAESGYKAGTQNIAYLFKVHADESEEVATEAGRKYLSGVDNPFIAGSEGQQWVLAALAFQSPPGLTSKAVRQNLKQTLGAVSQSGLAASTISQLFNSYEDQVKEYSIISGTPKTVIPKMRHVLEYLRPGSVFLWDGDGAMTHEDQMCSFRLMGQEIIPAVKEMGKALDLKSPFDTNDGTGIQRDVWAKYQAKQTAKA
ncbi:MAG: LLM class flavin-dependent oxidoreductase [Dehalococcoidia bacterium]|nr:LLM class flavin-dependent oxidoreductase [Dehalococcoidia bacterium]